MTTAILQRLLYCKEPVVSAECSQVHNPEGIHPRVLKEVADVMTGLLLIIYQRSWESGEVPDDWKVTNVIPIYRKCNEGKVFTTKPLYFHRVSVDQSSSTVACSLHPFWSKPQSDMLHPGLQQLRKHNWVVRAWVSALPFIVNYISQNKQNEITKFAWLNEKN